MNLDPLVALVRRQPVGTVALDDGGLALLLGVLGLAGLRTGDLPRQLAIPQAGGVNALAPLVLAVPMAALGIRPEGSHPSSS
jgi:hypothetical protein